MKKYSKKEIVIISLFVFLVLVSIIGITFAWFSAQVEGNDTASTMVVEMANLKLEFTDTNIIEGDKVLPGWTRTKTFTVENLGNVAVNYDIDIIDVASTFEGQDLVYEITSDNDGGTKTEAVLPNINGTLIVNAVIEPLTTQTYTIKITFKETGEDQNIDQGKSYRGKLQITPRISSVAIAGYALDAQGNAIPNRVVELHSDPVSTTTDSSGYYEFRDVPVGEHTLILKNSSNTAEEASKTVMLAYGNDVSYDNNTMVLNRTLKKYVNIELIEGTINLVVEDPSLILGESSGIIYLGGLNKEVEISGKGYGTLSCTSSDDTKATCNITNNVLKITPVGAGTGIITVRESNFNKEVTYSYEVKEVSLYLSNNGGTTFVGGITTSESINGSNYGQLSCSSSNSSIASCSISGTNLLITSGLVAGSTTITLSEANLSLTANYNIEVKANLLSKIITSNTPQSDSSLSFSTTTGTGLYYTSTTARAEDGKTIYYYRGNVTNNWVTFGGYKWRIVRTTSEGGVKLIYSGAASTTSSGFINTGTNYGIEIDENIGGFLDSAALYRSGYTYNENSYSGIQTNSLAKSIVDNWYTGTFIKNCATCASYLSTTAIFCADRSTIRNMSGAYIYPGSSRLESSAPRFTCPSTNQSRYTVSSTTGNGYLSNPIALITTDEAAFAGMVYEGSASTSYLVNNASSTNYWTMTPIGANSFEGTSFIGAITTSGVLTVKAQGVPSAIRPVVSLKACVNYASGAGTSASPYVISNANC